jgi:hypothetical protein
MASGSLGEQPKHGNQKQQVCRRGEHRRGKCVSRPRRRWVLGAPTDVTCRLIGSLHANHCPVTAPRLESLLSSFDRPIHTVVRIDICFCSLALSAMGVDLEAKA